MPNKRTKKVPTIAATVRKWTRTQKEITRMLKEDAAQRERWENSPLKKEADRLSMKAIEEEKNTGVQEISKLTEIPPIEPKLEQGLKKPKQYH